MEFRPCIDIHNGKVKQIVGGTLKDQNDQAAENFVSEQAAPFYAQLYKRYGISGGHIILLNARDSSYYEATKLQALAALQVYPGGLQVGGGITAENAHEFLMAGATAVSVGTANFFNPYATIQIAEGIQAFMEKQKIQDLGEIIGCVE